MRLKPWEVDAIKACLKESFGERARVYLFGSRVDDAKRGGDIDLYIVAEPLPEDWWEKRGKFWICMQKRLGEQKIDIVVARHPEERIEQVAMRDGILL
ncbi:nucleotidyltransferase domain-containing protein [Hydrogenimonas urashimensis]|uniref:nucleotidyltransferase domain-containing protein n=1 Tax=Hydrogenimonas urashimensis TaxID=2740515 RepID=UPI0019164DFB|nr:nucleotidyltransferase domain-containing protein [Hydrogenimonas urashimensis]